ncbi:MAG: DUF4260 domain-containing protein [Bradyrhizobium sp.]|jgi:hypothetical protein
MGNDAGTQAQGAVTGGLRILLRLEGLALFAAMIWLLFLSPDLSFAAYLAGARPGAIVYNAAHSTIGPVALAVAGFGMNWPLAMWIAITWLAHIGMDRMVGYGLKYGAGFGFTHLGGIGGAAKAKAG